jgi:hypothetical protein
MKLRQKATGVICHSDRFNTHGLSEIIVYFDDDCDSDYITNYEVELGIGDEVYWKDLSQAFKDRDVISDNHNTWFFEPKNEEDKKRGYTLD